MSLLGKLFAAGKQPASFNQNIRPESHNMVSPMSIPGVNMNDATNLTWYTLLLKFQCDFTRSEVCFSQQSNAEQFTIQTIAHALDLDYEYSRVTRAITVTRPLPSPIVPHGTPLVPERLIMDFSPGCHDDIFFDQPYDLGIQSASVPTYMPQNHAEQDAFPVNMTPGGLRKDDFPPTMHLMDQQSVPLDTSSIWTSSKSDSANQHPDLLTSNHLMQDEFENTFNDVTSMLAANDRLQQRLNHDQYNYSRQPATDFSTLLYSPWQANSGETMFSPGRSHSCASSAGSRAGSRAASINSNQSDRGRSRISKLFSRRSSAASRASSTFQEVVFDSKPGRSSSVNSRASGRRGPLDAVARAAANAVKVVKACWRCRVLRKPCDLELPCKSCPKKNRTDWYHVGCRRDDLTTGISTLSRCQNLNTHSPRTTSRAGSSNAESPAALSMGFHYLETLQIRQKECESVASIRSSNEPQPSFSDNKEGSVVQEIRKMAGMCEGSPEVDPLALSSTPAEEAVLNIAWEIHHCSMLRVLSIFGLRAPSEIITLLQSASIHQEFTTSDQLISQSLICLRSSLELLRIDDYAAEQGFSHEPYGFDSCIMSRHCRLEQHLNSFVDEFSRVMFKKENTHNKSWWFSAFYSLCIHEYVRRALLEYFKTSDPPERQLQGSNVQNIEYLQLAVRLFIACSGKYDPLGDRRVLDEEELARKAILTADWENMGVKSSEAYLSKVYNL